MTRTRFLYLACLLTLLFGPAISLVAQARVQATPAVIELSQGEQVAYVCAGQQAAILPSAANRGILACSFDPTPTAVPPTATALPSPTATVAPTLTPSPSPTGIPTAIPSATPTATVPPTPTATIQPTAVPEQQLSTPVTLGAFLDLPKNGTTASIGSALSWHAGNFGADRFAFREALKTAGYTGKHYTYILPLEVQNPAGVPYAPWPNNPAYRAGDWSYLNNQPTWFLLKKNADGSFSRISHGSSSGMYAMDPCSTGYRAWFYARIQQMQQPQADNPQTGVNEAKVFARGMFPDGIFLDNTPLSWDLETRKAGTSTLYTGSKQQLTSDKYVACAVDLVKGLRAAVGPELPIWGNLIEGKSTGSDVNIYFERGGLSGAHFEQMWTGWTQYNAPWNVQRQNGDLSQAEWLISRGYGLQATTQGVQADTQTQQFALANWLLIVPAGNTDQVTFRYADGRAYGELWRYDNYQARLGEPLSSRYAVAGGWARNFEGGRVRVDQINRRGYIEVKTP
jgi:hypothetical protein